MDAVHADCEALVDYLYKRGFIGSAVTIKNTRNGAMPVRFPILVRSKEADMNNLQDSRSFAFVFEDQPNTIFYARVLNCVYPAVRVAILLHEIAHLITDAMHSEDDEVDVDAWIIKNIPEAGYHYENCQYSPGGMIASFAPNVQHVSSEFVRAVCGGRYV